MLIVSTTRLVFRISSESVPMSNGNSSPETLKTSPEISQNYPKWRPGVAKEAHEVLDMPRMQHAAGLGGSGRPRSAILSTFSPCPGRRETLKSIPKRSNQEKYSNPNPSISIQGSGVRVQGSGFRVQGPGFRLQGSGFGFRG